MTTEKPSVQRVIENLGLQEHPDGGGYFKEIYRSGVSIEWGNSKPSASTSIYYLMTPTRYNKWHKVAVDENIYFLGGSLPAKMDIILGNSEHKTVYLGGLEHTAKSDLQFNLHFTVPANSWFTIRCMCDKSSNDNDGYALLSGACTPGFEFSDFTAGDVAELMKAFPQHAAAIQELP